MSLGQPTTHSFIGMMRGSRWNNENYCCILDSGASEHVTCSPKLSRGFEEMAVPLRIAVAKEGGGHQDWGLVRDDVIWKDSGTKRSTVCGHNLISVRKLAKDGFHQGNQLYADAYQFLVKIDTRRSNFSTNHDFKRILALI